MKIETIVVTPKIAKEMLSTMGKNRKLRPRHLHEMVEDMEQKRWVFDGAPLRFSISGRLLDGQHRLMAVITSGTTQTFLVVRDLPEESQLVMDMGARRTTSDALGLMGCEHRSVLATITRYVLAWEAGDRSITGFGRDVSHQAVRLRASSDEKLAIAARIPNVIVPPTITGFCWYEFFKRDSVLADEFLALYCDGANLGHGNPVLSLRNRLTADVSSANKVKLTTPLRIILFIRAWNAMRRGEKLYKVMLWRSNAESRSIPEII